jgi:uncharacterized protein Yka (UPF0111/DUF47 family)
VAETPGAFFTPIAASSIFAVVSMNDKVLDRVHKLGPVVAITLAVLGLASVLGASQWQLSELARGQREMAADIRHIREVLAAMQVTLRFTQERVTELDGRVRHLERR